MSKPQIRIKGSKAKPTEIEKQINSLTEKIAQLQNDNLVLMDALATIYEEIITLGGDSV